MVDIKKCTVCARELNVEMYTKNNFKKDGLQDQCRDCTAESNSRNVAKARLKYPIPYDICVYAFKRDDEVVYIGESKDTPLRVYEHLDKTSEKSIFHINGITRFDRKLNYTWHILWYGDTREDAKHQEKILIQIHQPKFNKIKYKSYEG